MDNFRIEYHHIHHLTPRIPSYNLQKCHENNKHLFNKITKVGYKQAFKSLFHTLYDEKEKNIYHLEFIDFLDYKLNLNFNYNINSFIFNY